MKCTFFIFHDISASGGGVFLVADWTLASAPNSGAEKSRGHETPKTPVLTKLRRLEQKRRLLLAETKTPEAVYWLLTASGAAARCRKALLQRNVFCLAVGLLGAFGPCSI